MRTCSVCSHPEAQSINAALHAGSPSVLQLAHTHNLSRDILNYHRRAHLLPPTPPPQPHFNSLAGRNFRLANRPRNARERFLKAFAEWGNMSAAAKAAGVSRTTVYDWQEHDQEFALAFKQADLQATESLEREAWRRAREGTAEPVYQHGKQVGTIQRYSDNLLMFLLKARAPERYRDRVDVSVTPVIKAVAGFDPASVI
jgi:hypothetical protein